MNDTLKISKPIWGWFVENKNLRLFYEKDQGFTARFQEDEKVVQIGKKVFLLLQKMPEQLPDRNKFLLNTFAKLRRKSGNLHLVQEKTNSDQDANHAKLYEILHGQDSQQLIDGYLKFRDFFSIAGGKFVENHKYVKCFDEIKSTYLVVIDKLKSLDLFLTDESFSTDPESSINVLEQQILELHTRHNHAKEIRRLFSDFDGLLKKIKADYSSDKFRSTLTESGYFKIVLGICIFIAILGFAARRVDMVGLSGVGVVFLGLSLKALNDSKSKKNKEPLPAPIEEFFTVLQDCWQVSEMLIDVDRIFKRLNQKALLQEEASEKFIESIREQMKRKAIFGFNNELEQIAAKSQTFSKEKVSKYNEEIRAQKKLSEEAKLGDDS